jgi:uroporphyrinogen decarboxylase
MNKPIIISHMKNTNSKQNEISRRSFVKSSIYSAVGAGLATAGLSSIATGCKPAAKNKRDLVLSVLDMSKANQYVPAAFFMHFGRDYNFGQAAVDRHLAYFRATDMDFVKIQYELGMPKMDLQTPSDWENVSVFQKDFFEPVLNIISGVVKEAKSEALIIPTVYSPLMCAGQIAGGRKNLFQQIQEHPDAVFKAMHKVTESVMNYIKAAIELGADGFYLSTQGMEVNGLPTEELHAAVDKALMEAPANFILGADCTIPNTTDWETLRTVIQKAHTFR